jgi:Tol biopolymer transport system component
MLDSPKILFSAACLLVSGLTASTPVPERLSPSRIAFASDRDGNWEIYVADSDGRRPTRLTNRTEAEDRFPLPSPNGSQIAFGSQVNANHWELWVMNADGGKPRSLATDIVAKGHRQWSHDGTRIAFAAKVNGDVEVFTVEVASGRITRLTNTPGEDLDPSWSPDDKGIAFSSMRDGNRNVYIARADGSQPRRLTTDTLPDANPDWSPDGTRLAYISGRDGARDVFMVRIDNGQVERLTTGARATNDGARWSPDGANIAVQTAQAVPGVELAQGYDIQLVRMSDRKRTTLAGSPRYDGQLSWSPESDRIAFISGREGVEAVYITDLSGKVSRLTTTRALTPVWTP